VGPDRTFRVDQMKSVYANAMRWLPPRLMCAELADASPDRGRMGARAAKCQQHEHCVILWRGHLSPQWTVLWVREGRGKGGEETRRVHAEPSSARADRAYKAHNVLDEQRIGAWHLVDEVAAAPLGLAVAWIVERCQATLTVYRHMMGGQPRIRGSGSTGGHRGYQLLTPDLTGANSSNHHNQQDSFMSCLSVCARPEWEKYR